MQLSWDLCEFLFNEVICTKYKYGGIELTTRNSVEYSSRSSNATVQMDQLLNMFSTRLGWLEDGMIFCIISWEGDL